MKGYGLCPSCLKHKYLHGRTCKICSYDTKECVSCKRHAKIYVDGLCYLCYQHRQVFSKIEVLEKNFIPLNAYNKQLFDLYLIYIRRYRLQYSQMKPTTYLIEVFEREIIPIIKNWVDVYTLSETYLIMQNPAKLQGCAFIKIGCILCELGVILPRENEQGHAINYQLSFFRTLQIKDYAASLLKLGTAQNTILYSLRVLLKLEDFGREHFKVKSLLELTQGQIANFLDSQLELIKSLQNKRIFFLEIRRFFAWAVLNRHISISPVPNFELARKPGRLLICSEEQFFDLQQYVRSEKTDSQRAFSLALVLYFGFSTEQLAQSQVILQGDCLCIKIKRHERTKGKRYYNRKELLKLPQNPKWFLELQKRFLKDWTAHYQKITKTYPHTPLMLPESNIHNRYLNTCTVSQRMKEATAEATGSGIPVRVLRQTCGHLYSDKADSSILATLGWSQQFAFHYSCLPRSYYQNETSPSSQN